MLSLSPFQINEICSGIPVNNSLPFHVRMSIIRDIRTRLSNDLEKVKIYPELYPKFKDEIIKYYYKTLCESGTAVGIQCAQSIGERQTQTTLSNFHFAGLSVKTVIVGVPRFSELLNATKSPKMVNCIIYLNEEFDDISAVRKRAGNMFTQITLKRLVKSYELIKGNKLEDWHILFCQIYSINPFQLGWRLRFHIDIDLLYEYKVSMKMIAETIRKEYSDSVVLYTPDWKGILDVFVDESCFSNISNKKHEQPSETHILDEDATEIDIEEEEEELLDIEEEEEEDYEKDDIEINKSSSISLSSKDKDKDVIKVRQKKYKEDVIPDDIENVIYMEDKVLPALLSIHISGIEGIKDIFFEKRKDEWLISTEGSNLYGLFANSLVDKTKTICNDMWEIYNIFGIEAVRQFLIEEYMDVVSSDGTYVNPSNVELLVDIMVYTGSIISISRYGQKKVGCGPMAKASFEESLENFLKAGINGEKESTDGVSASIMLGKMPKTGTGVFDLMMDLEKILRNNKDNKDNKDNKEEKIELKKVKEEVKEENMEP